MFTFLGSPAGVQFVLSLAGLFAATATYIKSRAVGGKVDTVTVHVNGRMTQLIHRNDQLVTLLNENGVSVPPLDKTFLEKLKDKEDDEGNS